MGIQPREPGMGRRWLRDDIDSWFDESLQRFWWPWRTKEPGQFTWGPDVDVFETEEDVVMRANIPGVDPKQIKLQVTESSITMSGESREDEEISDRGYYRRERRFGSFSRYVPLPVEVQPEKADATYRHGILTVKVPKAVKSRGRVVDIKAE